MAHLTSRNTLAVAVIGFSFLFGLSNVACDDGREAVACPDCLATGSGGSGSGGGNSAPPPMNWIDVYGDMHLQSAYCVVTDSQSNIYVAGTYAGTAAFNGGTLPDTMGAHDFFLVKLTSAGNLIWLHPFQQMAALPNSHVDIDLALDSQDNLVVVGNVQTSTSIGLTDTQVYMQDGIEPELFIAKLDPDGGHIWSREFAARTARPTARDVVIADDDSIHVVGDFNANVDSEIFGVTVNGNGIYHAKLTGDGANVFVNHYTSLSVQGVATSAVVNPNGDSVLLGTFEEELTLTDTSTLTASSVDMLLVKLDPDGAIVWKKQFGSGRMTPSAMVGDDAGNLYLTGAFVGTLNFGGGASSSEGDEYDVFIAKLDGAGNEVWVNSYTVAETQRAGGLALSPNQDALAVTGTFKSAITFGQRLEASQNEDMFVTMLTTDGTPVWAVGLGGPQNQAGRDVAFLPNGGVVFVGNTQADLEVGGTPLEATDAMVFGQIGP